MFKMDHRFKCKNVKFINFYLKKKKRGKNLPDLGLSPEFLDLVPKVQSTKE